MNDRLHEPHYLLHADVTWRTLETGSVRARTTHSTFEVRLPGEELFLTRLFEETLPKLALPATPEALGRGERELFLRLLPELERLGIVCALDAAVARDLRSAADVRLYTFLARRSAQPSPWFKAAKTSPVEVVGPGALTAPLAGTLREQGLEVRVRALGLPGEAERPGRLIACATHDQLPFLRRLDRWAHATNTRWVPLVWWPNEVHAGPFVAPGETACLSCAAPGEEAPSPGEDIPSRPAWASLRPGALSWVVGVTSELILQTVLPLGPHTPWGRRVTFRCGGPEMRPEQVWRRPDCATCGVVAPETFRWAVPACR